MATALEPRPLADEVEQALIRLDRDFTAVYGPIISHWSTGVRGEFLETQRTRRSVRPVQRPEHPRRPSAGRRRRHVKQLAYRIRTIAPGAVTVLITWFWSDATGDPRRVPLAQCLDAEGRRVSLPNGGSMRLASLLQAAFPGADWDRALTWHADNGQLTAWKAAVS